MAELRVLELLSPPKRFLRSAHLERDFEDPRALEGYVVTPPIAEALERVAVGLEPDSTRRAWRITGDYGIGKSSFGLALARLFRPDSGDLPPALAQIRSSLPGEGLLPVLVTGSRERMSTAVLRGLKRALERTRDGGRIPNVLKDTETTLRRAAEGATPDETDAAAIALLQDAVEYVARSANGGRGILLILDEMGKFLEYAALDPASQDVYFLQRLGEAAARSGERPLVVVGLLHQGFYAYAENLTEAAQKEWEKVSGRFEEILFDHPLEHTAELVAGALGVDLERLPPTVADATRRAMEGAIKLGWYGPAPARDALIALAPRLYPLHPSVLPPLIRLLGRFGQNERSVFSFLLAHEPGGLQAFASSATVSSGGEVTFYRLPDLFDYVRATLGHRLGAQSYRSHWPEISATVDACHAENAVELDVVKTVAVLNLLNAHDLLATTPAIELAVGGSAEVKASIAALQNGRKVLHDRGALGGYALWPHTSVNLERAIEAARTALGPLGSVAPHLMRHLPSRPLVARRHYIETGNLRHFEIRYAGVSELEESLRRPTRADGMIVVALPETPTERDKAVEVLLEGTQLADATTIALVPRPLAGLAGSVDEVRRWEWVAANTPELNHDRYAAEEVARQLEHARIALAEQLREWIGLHSRTTSQGARWIRAGKEIEPPVGREFVQFLSDVCDEVYPDAPRIHNELVNRASISAAAAGARMRLIERVLERASEPMLGLPEKKAPPEKSMYLSVLRAGNLHVPGEDGWTVRLPDAEVDPLNLRPALLRIARELQAAPDGRVPVTAIYDALRAPPFGVREGLLPLLLAVFVKVHEADVAIYERGTFLRHVGGVEFLRLTKAPETFDVQFYPVAGIRADLFEHLLEILGRRAPGHRPPRLLDVVTPLVTFAAQLPEYVLETRTISATACAVRQALLESREPATLIYRSLPEACGVAPFSPGETAEEGRVRTFVEALRGAIEELRAAYPELLDRIRSELFAAFDLPREAASRRVLGERAVAILPAIQEPRLRALCTRLADFGLTDDAWLEAFASFVRERPPTRWTDEDARAYSDDVRLLAKRFRHVEGLVFAEGPLPGTGTAVRVAITRPDGTEVHEVVYTGQAEEEQVAQLEHQIAVILAAAPRNAGLAAASRAVLRVLAGDEPDVRPTPAQIRSP